jgi:hypothetical protein
MQCILVTIRYVVTCHPPKSWAILGSDLFSETGKNVSVVCAATVAQNVWRSLPQLGKCMCGQRRCGRWGGDPRRGQWRTEWLPGKALIGTEAALMRLSASSVSYLWASLNRLRIHHSKQS